MVCRSSMAGAYGQESDMRNQEGRTYEQYFVSHSKECATYTGRWGDIGVAFKQSSSII